MLMVTTYRRHAEFTWAHGGHPRQPARPRPKASPASRKLLEMKRQQFARIRTIWLTLPAHETGKIGTSFDVMFNRPDSVGAAPMSAPRRNARSAYAAAQPDLTAPRGRVG